MGLTNMSTRYYRRSLLFPEATDSCRSNSNLVGTLP